MDDSNRDASPARLDCRRTRVRFLVVGMGVLMAMVTYLDRACISVLAPDIIRELSLTKVQMGFVFSAFALAYAIFEIPTAWWADRLGTRKVLTRIVAWWSTFTVATAAAPNYVLLLATRFLFGVGEAGAWPSAARTFSRWIPCRERGTVQGVFFSGAYLAGGLTPLVGHPFEAMARLAGNLRPVRIAGVRLGPRLVLLVSRRSIGARIGQCRGVGIYRARAPA